MDLHSFLLNLEVTVTIYDKGVVRKLQAIEQTYMARSVRVSRSAWAKRSRLKRLIDNLARLTSSLQ